LKLTFIGAREKHSTHKFAPALVKSTDFNIERAKLVLFENPHPNSAKTKSSRKVAEN